MPIKPAVVTLAALLLAACSTATPEQRLALDRATCQGYGFSERSEGFANCLMRLDLDRRAERRERLNRPPPFPSFPTRVIVVERPAPERPAPERPDE